MKTERLNLTPSCWFEVTSYEDSSANDVSLDYVEHTSDHWHSDSDTSVAISQGDAQKIIAFLTSAFSNPGLKTI